MTTFILPSKLVAERVTVEFSFNADLNIGETIVGQVITIEVVVGEDPNPEELLYQVAASDGQVVTQQIHEGLPGVIYQLLCTATTSSGQIVEAVAKLAILPAPAIIPDIFGTRYTTRPYPLEHSAEITNSVSFVSGRLREMPFPIDYMTQTIAFVSGTLRDLLVDFAATEEYIQHVVSFVSGTLRDLLILIDVPEDSMQHELAFVNGELRDVLIEYSPLPDNMQHSISFISGTLS